MAKPKDERERSEDTEKETGAAKAAKKVAGAAKKAAKATKKAAKAAAGASDDAPGEKTASKKKAATSKKKTTKKAASKKAATGGKKTTKKATRKKAAGGQEPLEGRRLPGEAAAPAGGRPGMGGALEVAGAPGAEGAPAAPSREVEAPVTTELKPGEPAPVPEPGQPPASPQRRVSALRPGYRLTDDDLYLWNEGSHFRAWEKLGAHPAEVDGEQGTLFAVWAPSAEFASVVGEFNGWDRESHPMTQRGSSGIWEAFVPGVGRGTLYKYFLRSHHGGYSVQKADPFAFLAEEPPRTASVVWDLAYDWGDGAWMESRGEHSGLSAPMSIYEMHLGSWMRVPEEGDRWLTYRELAPKLVDYLQRMGFTHVEFMPVMEHPFFGSWGYQVTGYYAPSSRFGTPQDFMYLIDKLHQAGIGVILDWVPSHFPEDEHGLAYFDGSYLFEHADPRQGWHPDWNSRIYNYGRREVQSFLISNALYWLDVFHVDGLRVDAVASMLYLDYSRKEGEWIPNEFGGRENIEAIDFLRRFNESVYAGHPEVETIAEESTAWPMVSRPTYVGGLGFGLKWDMGWMHDTLKYMEKDPIHRKWHHNDITFRMVYAFNENFVLPLSHDEVVHGKGSLLDKMPGDLWQKFANLRLLYAYMWSQPGKKLLFMGGEFGQWKEWNHDSSLEWHLAHEGGHVGVQQLVADLNDVYRSHPAMHALDAHPEGFEWIEGGDAENSVLSFLRKGREPNERVLVVLNFTPAPRHNYRVGVPLEGRWRELLNSDAGVYGGSGQGNMGGVETSPVPMHGRAVSLNLTVPPLGAVFLEYVGE